MESIGTDFHGPETSLQEKSGDARRLQEMPGDARRRQETPGEEEEFRYKTRLGSLSSRCPGISTSSTYNLVFCTIVGANIHILGPPYLPIKLFMRWTVGYNIKQYSQKNLMILSGDHH